MNTSKSLDEIFKQFWDDHYKTLIDDTAPNAEIKAKQAIVEAVEGLIGKDEDVPPERHIAEWPSVYRNKFRAELRQAIKEWQNGA